MVCLKKGIPPWYMVTLRFHVSVQPKKEENPSVKEQELLFFIFLNEARMLQ